MPYKTVYNWYKEETKKDSKNADEKNDLKYKDFQSYNKEAAEKVKIRLIKLLKEELLFDINGYAGKDNEKLKEKRDFISFIYDIKKECQEGSIFQVLAKPHLENIYNEYSESCKNDKIYKIIYNRTLDKLQNENYAIKSYEIYHKADYEFELILWGYRNSVIFAPKKCNSVNKLNETLCYIKENFTDGSFEGPYALKENLIKSFFNLLVCHQIISKESDKINMNNSLYYLEEPSGNYIKSLEKNFRFFQRKNVALEEMKKYFNGIPTDEGECLWNYITYGKYDETDKEYYEYALKKFDESYRIYYECAKEDNYIDDGWYNPYYEEPHMRNKAIYDKINILENVSIIELIAIMQELIYMKKNKLEFNNTFYNNKNIPKDMVNKLKAGDLAEAAAKMYFKRCVQNRIAHNFGKCEEMKIWRTIENELYKLKIQLFSIYDIKAFDSTMYSILLLLRLLDLDEIGYSC
ncbi:MAG: hypothetical protein NC340_00825 [Ruminococcus flavefaciens]|nr:hypothetical protein [Ruminococcus flavefaciens]MCM1228691.1 hypothetical protein [Ruminococcus flavefaciens]